MKKSNSFELDFLACVTDLDAIRYKKAAENLRATVIFALCAPIDLGLLLLHVL